MKRYLCALLALALCLGGALAEEADAPTEVPQTQAPEPTPTPVEATPAPPEETPAPAEAETAAPTEVPAEAADAPEATPAPEEAPPAAQNELATLEGPGTEGAPLLAAPRAADEGYVMRDGAKQAGALKDLLDGQSDLVYVTADAPVTISDFRLGNLRGVTLKPDPEKYPGEDYAVTLKAGGEALAPERIEAASDETIELTVAVEKRAAEPGEPTDPPSGGEGDAEPKLEVLSPDYVSGAWLNAVEFHLAGKPEEGGYSYVALIYDERFVPLLSDVYVPEEGEYTLRFAILDARGDVVDASPSYPLMLDCTPPELAVEVSTSRDYTMTISGGDALSGVAELSLDGGETWTKVELGEGLSVVHTESRKRTFPPEMIRVRDAAGNESWNAEEIVLDKLPREAPMSWGGGGGGGGDSSAPSAPHASGDGDDAPYDSYELALPEGAVDALTLGGEEIDLGLEVEGAPAQFTAELTSWATEGGAPDGAEPPKDTLVIRAQTGAAPGPYACSWRINGAVLRKLYNSDISYLALAAGDAMLGLPTVGFTAGTRYAELKMEGVSTSEFEYEIVMRVEPGANAALAADDWNRSPDCAVEIWVEVDGERFELVDRATTPEMYPFDVYCGSADLAEYPFGAYPLPEGV